MNDSMFFFIIGLAADIITIVLVIIDISIHLRTRFFSLKDKTCCRFEVFYGYKYIPRRWKIYEGGSVDLNVYDIVSSSGEMNKKEYFIMMIPYAHNIIRKIEIYQFDNLKDEKNVTLKNNYRLIKEYNSISHPICINESIGSALPGIIIQWWDNYGKHRYYSNTEMIVHNRECKDILF